LIKPVSKNQLKRLAKLRMKKYREAFGLYLISGERAVQGSLAAQNLNIDSVLLTEAHADTLEHLCAAHPGLSDREQLLLTDAEFSAISDEQHPQGIALVAAKPLTRFDPEHCRYSRLIYLDRISDPGNLGTIIRTALWFGVETILLSPGSVDPYQGKVVRSSAGAITQTKIFEDCSLQELLVLKDGHGFSLIAATVKGGLPLHDLSNRGNICLLFGSEASGLDDRLTKICDIHAHIPGTGRIESLNLAISAACFLYHLNSKSLEVSS